MELRSYWEVVRARAWVVVGLLVLALGTSLAGLALVPQATSYQATMTLAVKPVPEPRTGDYYTFDDYYPYLSSEFLNDDVIKLVQGGVFMQDLQARLKTRFPNPPSGSIKAEKTHRVLVVTVTSRTGEGALALAEATREALSDRKYFEQLTDRPQTVSVLDPPAITATPGSRAQLDLALRGLLGLLAGLALAFLLDYLDDTVRGPDEVEQLLGEPVLGEIPPERAGRRFAPRPRLIRRQA